MKYVNHAYKGTFGYIRRQTLFELIKTIILFAMALGIFFIGYKTLGTKKNLWTVIAILGLLPASKSLVGLIMFLRYKSLNRDIYDIYERTIGKLPVLYENVFTTNEKSYYVPILCYAKGTLIGYIGDSEKIIKVKSHIDNVLLTGGHKGITVKLFDKEEDFLKRAEEMRDHFEDIGDNKASEAVFTTIKAVSL